MSIRANTEPPFNVAEHQIFLQNPSESFDKADAPVQVPKLYFSCAAIEDERRLRADGAAIHFGFHQRPVAPVTFTRDEGLGITALPERGQKRR
jgi:hypothetical protein